MSIAFPVPRTSRHFLSHIHLRALPPWQIASRDWRHVAAEAKTTQRKDTMKKFIALTLATIGVATSARAQWVVYDPTLHTQSILNTAQEIAKYIEMINNQVQQIQALTSQLNEFKHYEDLFGDPKSVLLATVKPLTDDLRKTELGQTLTTLEGTVNAGQAMLYNASGLFHSVGTTFTTPNGQTVTRQQAPYLPVAAVQKTTDNYLAVSTDATTR